MAREIREAGMASRPRRHVEGVDDELSGHRSRGLPADDATTKDIGDEGDVNRLFGFQRGVMVASSDQLGFPA